MRMVGVTLRFTAVHIVAIIEMNRVGSPLGSPLDLYTLTDA
jgi:hypothetical protein